MCYAWSRRSVSTFHENNYGTFQFFIDSSNNVSFASNNNSLNFYQIKGIILIICWICLNFIGIYAAVYLKHLTYWIHIHRICSGISAVATIILGFISIVNRK